MAAKKILIVDDDKDFVQLLQFDLQKHGCQPIVAYDGEEGLKKAKEENPDLVLLDIKLPKMSGEVFFKELQRVRKDLPVVVLSAYVEDPSIRDHLTRLGVKKVISKKADQKELLDAILLLF